MFFPLIHSIINNKGEGVDSKTLIPESDKMIFSWTDNTTSAFELSFDSSKNYDCYIEWGDGGAESFVGSGDVISHTYSNSGQDVDVKISGICPAVRFNNYTAKSRFKEMKQWGNTGLDSLYYMFSGLTGVVTISATDTAGLKGVTDFTHAFYGTEFTGNIEVDTTSATTLNGMFGNSNGAFTVGDINAPNCTNADSLFYYSEATQVGSIDLPVCTSLNSAFRNCSGMTGTVSINAPSCSSLAFGFRNSPLINTVSITTQSVTDMAYAFDGMDALTDLGTLDCSSLASTYNLDNFLNSGTPNLTQLNITNYAGDLIDLTGTSLGAFVLNTIFTNLADRTSISAGSIDITGTPGASDSNLTESIATGKNWDVVGVQSAPTQTFDYLDAGATNLISDSSPGGHWYNSNDLSRYPELSDPPFPITDLQYADITSILSDSNSENNGFTELSDGEIIGIDYSGSASGDLVVATVHKGIFLIPKSVIDGISEGDNIGTIYSSIDDAIANNETDLYVFEGYFELTQVEGNATQYNSVGDNVTLITGNDGVEVSTSYALRQQQEITIHYA